jgi:heptosyltransferase-2
MERDRIVIRGLNWFGDAIMSLPALQKLREARPEAHIAILTPVKLSELWRPPLVDEVICFESGESLGSVVRKLRTGQFATGIVLPMSFRSAMELWLAGIPTRIGTEHKCREAFLSHPVPKPVGLPEMKKRTVKEILRVTEAVDPKKPDSFPLVTHHVYRYLNLVAVLGADPTPVAPCLPIEAAEAEAVHDRFFPGRPRLAPLWMGMCPGAEYGPAKRWPEERFVEAACRLHQQTGCEWLLFGGPSDRAACERISAAICAQTAPTAANNLAGRTSLRELAALLRGCSVVIGNDSGPMHCAAAVGAPVSVIFSSTSAGLTGQGLPGSASHSRLTSSAPCSPCFLPTCPIDMRCMNSLTVERMVQSVLDLLPK